MSERNGVLDEVTSLVGSLPGVTARDGDVFLPRSVLLHGLLALRAIEAEAATSPMDGGLNVKRLARALTQALVVPDSETAERDAVNIAHEYAALSETAEPGFKLSDYDPDTEGRGGT